MERSEQRKNSVQKETEKKTKKRARRRRHFGTTKKSESDFVKLVAFALARERERDKEIDAIV